MEPRGGGAKAPERNPPGDTTMNTEQAKQLADNALNLLIEALEKGQSETLKRYLATMGRFHNYSFGNCLMIAAQKPDATHVAGFHAWLRFQRHVRKGEKGIVILAPMVGKKKAEAAETTDTEDAQSSIFGFRAAHVFDVSQTDGEPLPEFAQVKGDPRGFTERLKAMITDAGISFNYSEKIAPAKGMSCGGLITLLAGMDAGEEFAVLVHEYAHEKLHRTERLCLMFRATVARAQFFGLTVFDPSVYAEAGSSSCSTGSTTTTSRCSMSTSAPSTPNC